MAQQHIYLGSLQQPLALKYSLAMLESPRLGAIFAMVALAATASSDRATL